MSEVGGFDVSEFRKIKSPATGRIHLVAKGNIDSTLDDTRFCPYSNDYMTLYDSTRTDLGVRMSKQEYMEWNKRYTVECPNTNCSFLKDNGTSYKQKAVDTDVLTQSHLLEKLFRSEEPSH